VVLRVTPSRSPHYAFAEGTCKGGLAAVEADAGAGAGAEAGAEADAEAETGAEPSSLTLKGLVLRARARSIETIRFADVHVL
jgi:hypothetical protein